MNLGVALNTARAALATTAKQIAVSGSNTTGADDPNRTRKIAQATTDAAGAVRVITVSRATDLPLYYRLLASKATNSGQQALVDGLTRLDDTVGDTADGSSPAARVAALATALQAQANAPADRGLAQATLTAAQSVVTTLANATQTVITVRNQADAAMADSVAKLNDLLGQLTASNNAAVSMTLAGEDATDALDKRDSILTEISEQIGITVVQRDHGDVAVYTDGGVTLFDKTPRSVTFTPTASLAPGVTGNPLMVDGMPVTGDNPTMPIHTGALAGLAALRDSVAPTYQAQLDEMARGLIASFSESDQSGGGGPDLAGLFTWSGGPALPAAGTLSSGLALTLKVNPAVDPAQGGNLDRIRDGGINGASYRYNGTGAASFASRIDGLVTAMNADRAFDPAAGVANSASLLSFSTSSVSWLEDQRQAAGTAADYQAALLSRATEALSNATGVNIDNEYTIQLQLEQSYQAASKLITLINSMMQTLLDALR